MLTIKRAAKKLRISESRLYRLCRSGMIPSIKKKGKWHINSIFDEHVFTTHALAESMGYSEQYIRRLCHDGTLRDAQKIGTQWRIPLKEGVRLMMMRLTG